MCMFSVHSWSTVLSILLCPPQSMSCTVMRSHIARVPCTLLLICPSMRPTYPNLFHAIHTTHAMHLPPVSTTTLTIIIRQSAPCTLIPTLHIHTSTNIEGNLHEPLKLVPDLGHLSPYRLATIHTDQPPDLHLFLRSYIVRSYWLHWNRRGVHMCDRVLWHCVILWKRANLVHSYLVHSYWLYWNCWGVHMCDRVSWYCILLW